MPDLSQRLQDALSGGYRIERTLGRGGMATVFLAEDLKHHRRVALKVLDPDVAAAIGFERFLREIETVARLAHPHILPLFDSGQVDGLLFYAMPHVEGGSLRDRLARENQLQLEESLQIAREVADALSYAHGRGLVHRDIKPENILLEEGHAVVADFGISRAVAVAEAETLTATGIAVGTPAYMSPEQAAGSKGVDGRSDLYSLGCVLYEMLAGQPPFTGATVGSLVHQHRSVEPRRVTELRPAVPAAVAAALQRALAKAPADRFASISLFVEALSRAESMPASPAPSASARQHGKIAVLPFQNLSAQGPYAYFAGGLHDELLTQLVKVAALKVISRTSVMGYMGTAKPLRQIGDELGVGSVVEGSVQVAGDRLRVNVQLIDAATDEHLWAERYDRTLDDAFAIQSEVAQKIVVAVGAALTTAEQGRLAAAPTSDAGAYRLYLQGRECANRPGYLRCNLECAQQLYERALVQDPGFALAHAALADVHGTMFKMRYDPSAARAGRQREEAETALRLAPELPQAHFAMGLAHYCGHRDYQLALEEFAIATRSQPNDGPLLAWAGYAQRRLGHWGDCLEAIGKVEQIDPRNADWFWDLGGHTFDLLHRHADAARACDRALSLAPDLHEAATWRGWTYARWQGRLDPLRAALSRVPRDAELGALGSAAAHRAALLLWERNAGGLLHELQTARVQVFDAQYFFLPSALYAAWAHELENNHGAARTAFRAAQAFLDSVMEELPDDWRVHAARGMALAGLGCRDEALGEAAWLQRSEVYANDATDGPLVAEDRARILARVGDDGAALGEIERLLAEPSLITVHTLRLDPRWNPIREHPRFTALLEEYVNPDRSACE